MATQGGAYWRGGGGGGQARGWGSGRGSRGDRAVCRFFQQGNCRNHRNCRFSHDSQSITNASLILNKFNARPERTSEELIAREDYRSWKSILRTRPLYDDLRTVQRLWSGALELLTNGERDWQQRLPQDLVDEEHLFGYQHVQDLMDMRPSVVGDTRFIQLARPFLMVITHSAFLDCLSVDMYVGDLYNFVSGSGGTRAVPFFQSFSNSLVEEHRASPDTNTESYEDVLVAMATALREVLRRTPKALFHEDLPALVESIGNASEFLGLDNNSVAAHTVATRVAELQRMIRRTQGILMENVDDGKEIANLVVASTYPRDIQLPGNRHDNDKRDITEINILPTEDEIRSERPEFLPSPNID
jgi:CCCH-type zinc finger